MKIGRFLTPIACLSLLAFLPEAQAASFSVSPTGQFDAQGIPSITYDVFFNVEPADGSFTFLSWDIDMQYDTSELGNPVASNVLAGNLTPVAGSPGTLNNLYLPPPTDPGVNLPAAGAYRLASVTFDILQPVQTFDGMADFSVVSQVGDLFTGFVTDQFEFLQFDGANGADVGAPVPVPAAVWLLGSGLIGLTGLRKRLGS